MDPARRRGCCRVHGASSARGGAVLAVILLASFVYAQVKINDSPQYQRPDWRGVAAALGSASGTRAIVRTAGLIPAALFGGGSASPIPAPLTLITSTFLHANFMHVFGNMIFLFVFGDDIEEALGHWRFLAFYLACGSVPASSRRSPPLSRRRNRASARLT